MMMSRRLVVIEAVSVLCIICSYYCSDAKYNTPSSFKSILYVSYLASLAVNFGMQFWVTFVAGLIMRRRLPRRTFGHIQGHLFPVYFMVGSILTAISLCIFLLVTPCSSWTKMEWIKVLSLDATFLAMFLQQVQLPNLLHNMNALFAMEKDLGIGDHDGTLTKGEREKCRANEKWRTLNQKFRIKHGISSLLNLITFLCTGMLVFYSGIALTSI